MVGTHNQSGALQVGDAGTAIKTKSHSNGSVDIIPADHPKENTSQRFVLHQPDRTKDLIDPHAPQTSQSPNDLLQPPHRHAGKLPDDLLLALKIICESSRIKIKATVSCRCQCTPVMSCGEMWKSSIRFSCSNK